LRDLAAQHAAHVFVSVTSLEDELAGRLEPRAARPHRRLQAIEALASAGVPVGVMVAPVIPGLNDSEIAAIVAAAADAGATTASYVLLRLPKPVDALFAGWLERHYPERVQRVLGRIRECRDGRISDSQFGRRMRGQGVYAEHISALFRSATRRHGLDQPLPPLSIAAFRRPPQAGDQLKLL
jgi:DNA repair photolyase